MRRKLVFFCTLLALGLPATAVARDAGPQPPPEPAGSQSATAALTVDRDARGNAYVAGELIVTLEETVPSSETGETAADVEARVQEQVPELDAAVLLVPEVKGEESGAEREDLLAERRADLLANPAVESVDYNYLRTLSAVPNDPRFSEQWGLTRIQAPDAWNTTRGNGSLIAIVDGGASGGHPDLAGAFVGQRDYYNNDATPNDEDGHGSHVSGIAAARTDNGRGIAGTAPGASLLNYDVCGQTYCSDAAINQAIVDAANAGADVINMSLGGGGSSSTQRNAVDYAWNRGTVLVAAAGNEAQDGNPVSFPAAYANVIAVGATTSSNTRANFSNYGAYVDVAAPGTSILSSIPPDGYASWGGTSMATPLVSGIAALLSSQGLTAQEIRSQIQNTATDLGTAGRDDQFGYGLVDAEAAIADNATPPPPPPGEDTTPPEVSSSNPSPERTGVSRRGSVTATVSEELDASSVDDINVQLYPNGANVPVDATVRCDPSCRTVTLDPASRLRAGTWYRVVLWKDSSGLRDLAGNPLESAAPYKTDVAGGYEYVYWWFKTRR